MSPKSIGDQELALLHYIDQQSPISVGEVAADFGAQRELARSTVLTMMERLRSKGFLRRRQDKTGVYRYQTTTGRKDVVRSAVGIFVENTLQGSVSPLVAWMAESADVSDSELAELEALVAKLQSQRKGGR